jgi:hypothetical protein
MLAAFKILLFALALAFFTNVAWKGRMRSWTQQKRRLRTWRKHRAFLSIRKRRVNRRCPFMFVQSSETPATHVQGYRPETPTIFLLRFVAPSVRNASTERTLGTRNIMNTRAEQVRQLRNIRRLHYALWLALPAFLFAGLIAGVSAAVSVALMALVVSALVLSAKCPYCHNSFHSFAPLIEMITGRCATCGISLRAFKKRDR